MSLLMRLSLVIPSFVDGKADAGVVKVDPG
jgi:hypothetical protein